MSVREPEPKGLYAVAELVFHAGTARPLVRRYVRSVVPDAGEVLWVSLQGDVATGHSWEDLTAHADSACLIREGMCAGCGCTESDACFPSCAWVTDTLCSQCTFDRAGTLPTAIGVVKNEHAQPERLNRSAGSR